MELFAIVLAGPAALVASAVYCLLLGRLVEAWAIVRRPLLAASIAVLALIVAEALVLSTVGASPRSAPIDLPLYVAHLALFVLGTPALANVLVLGPFGTRTGKWYIVAPVCAVFAMATTLMQYVVSEAVHGVS